MLKCGGRFILYMYMTPTIPFQKPYANPHVLVELLKSRGLTIQNSNEAEYYLSTIGYYRLSAYMYPFLIYPTPNDT